MRLSLTQSIVWELWGREWRFNVSFGILRTSYTTGKHVSINNYVLEEFIALPGMTSLEFLESITWQPKITGAIRPSWSGSKVDWKYLLHTYGMTKSGQWTFRRWDVGTGDSVGTTLGH